MGVVVCGCCDVWVLGVVGAGCCDVLWCVGAGCCDVWVLGAVMYFHIISVMYIVTPAVSGF